MSEPTKLSEANDPLRILGLPDSASDSEVRSRYLELVRQYPPEREAEKFRSIHAAYKEASDPLLMAKRLLNVDITNTPRSWSDVIAEQKQNPPRLDVDVLLSLGNRGETNTIEPAE